MSVVPRVRNTIIDGPPLIIDERVLMEETHNKKSNSICVVKE